MNYKELLSFQVERNGRNITLFADNGITFAEVIDACVEFMTHFKTREAHYLKDQQMKQEKTLEQEQPHVNEQSGDQGASHTGECS